MLRPEAEKHIQRADPQAPPRGARALALLPLLGLHEKYALIFKPTATELAAWNVLDDRATEKVVTKTGLFEVDLTAMKADCVAMTAAKCNPLDFDSLSDWALGVQWVVDTANKPVRDAYNTVFFPKQGWAVTCYWD